MSEISESTIRLIDAIHSHSDVYTHESDGDHTGGKGGASSSPVRPDARTTRRVFAAILRRMAMADRMIKHIPLTRHMPLQSPLQSGGVGGGNVYMSPLIVDESTSPFLSADVRSEIVNNHHTHASTWFHYTWNIAIDGQQTRYVDLYLSYPDDAVPISEAAVLQRVRLIFIWLQIAVPLSARNCSSRLRICMYFTNVLKQTPADDHHVFAHAHSHDQSSSHTNDTHPLEYTHVNSAVARTCMQQQQQPETIRDICLFREEEWLKVFIHETFHSLGFDFSGIAPSVLSRVDDEMRKAYPMIPTTTPVNLFEMYCETWAGILNVLMIVFAIPRNRVVVRARAPIRMYITPKRPLPNNRKRRPITRRRRNSRIFAGQFHAESIAREAFLALEHEIAFCGLQAVKVLHLAGKINPSHIWLKPPRTTTKTPTQFYTNTSAFSYFILRSFVLRRFCEFVAWCSNHQAPNTVLLPFSIPWTTPGVLDEFILRFVIHPFYASSIIGIGNNGNSVTEFTRLSLVEAKDHVAFLTRMAGTLRTIQQSHPTENTSMFLQSMRMTLYSIY